MSPADRASQATRYRKLPGDFRGFFRRNTIWLADDHLLLVDSTRFSETYKRFYLRDIQSIIIRKTPRFVMPYYWVVLIGVVLVLTLIATAPFRPYLFWPPVAILAGIVLYLYIASMFRSCTCHLITRVNKTELPSLFRQSAARRFQEAAGPAISAAQGSLPADWLERSTTLEELSTAADRNPDAPVDLLSGGQFSWITVAVFASVLGDAVLTWIQLRSNDARAYSNVNLLNMLALAACATVAIVRLSRQRGVRGLRVLVVGGLFAVAGANYGSMLLQSFDEQIYHRTFQNMLLYPGMRPLGIGEILVDLAVAIPGLVLALRLKQVSAKPGLSFLDTGASPQ